MGFRLSKSFKVMPGVRMTVSRHGIGGSVGGRGARITRTASGRVTHTIGIPGTGIRHTSSEHRRRRSPSPTRATRSGPPRPHEAAPEPARPLKPGIAAPRWEKDLHHAVVNGRIDDLPRIAQSHPEAAPVAAALDGFTAFANRDPARAVNVLGWLWETGTRIEDHPFMRKYLAASTITVGIADGVDAELPFSRDAVGLVLAELHQEAGNPLAAISVVEALDPSSIAAVSLAELYVQTGRHADVVELTNGISNVDDPTALLVTFRGVALREQGYPTAAREAFKEALKSRSRDAAIRHRALLERAEAYRMEGKLPAARKDLERVLAEDGNYPGVREALQAMSGSGTEARDNAARK